ncbi:DUF2871 domain-containing protein [Anaerorhabdus sp.]|jgi:small-conductance mechanosensitive channel|uniref:DUF2871 domain-containing protein n=1 Tax=Anaerorhabdus sp. TaxID=1872524 RepID=UPI002FC7B584
MKKMINVAFIYSIVAMIAGVFYREFTKFNGFVGVTSLGKMHVHLLVLGSLFFLILGLYCDRVKVEDQKGFNTAFIAYNVGLCWMVVMMLVRGILQVLNTPLSSGINAAISGVAGIGHIILGVGLVLIFLKLKKAVK